MLVDEQGYSELRPVSNCVQQGSGIKGLRYRRFCKRFYLGVFVVPCFLACFLEFWSVPWTERFLSAKVGDVAVQTTVAVH